jgi:drug/metabolite transporter (DMT)-like permease
MQNSKISFWAYFQLVIIQVCFGMLPFTGKMVMRELSPETFILMRMSGAGLVFMAVAVLQNRHQLKNLLPRNQREWALLAIAGLCGIALNPLLFAHGLKLSTSVHANMIQLITPILTLMLAISLNMEKFYWNSLIGFAIAISGVSCLVLQKDVAVGTSSTVGNLLLVANSFAYAIYLVILKRLDLHTRGWINTFWIFAFATLGLGLFNYPSLATLQWPTATSTTWFWLGFTVFYKPCKPSPTGSLCVEHFVRRRSLYAGSLADETAHGHLLDEKISAGGFNPAERFRQ